MEVISIIIPCYNEEDSIPLIYNELKKVSNNMRYGFEFIFVNDGSIDNSLSVLKKLSAKDKQVKYIHFSRNFGKEAAMYAGLSNSKGDYVTIMDADLQDPPSLLPEMLRLIKEEEYDSVGTRRVSRKGEPKIRSFFARKFYKIINRLSKIDVVIGELDKLIKKNKITLFISSLYGIEKGMYNSKHEVGKVNFSVRVPLVVDDYYFNKTSYTLNEGTVYDLANTIYKNINSKYNIDGLIKKKSNLLSFFYKKPKKVKEEKNG